MTWTHYHLQVSIYLIAFYLFYRTLLGRETYFLLNRIYLLSATLLSLGIPFMKAEWFMGKTAPQFTVSADQLQGIMGNVSQANQQAAPYNWGALVAGIYIAGILLLAGRMLFRLLMVRRLIRSNPEGKAFSFFSRKVIGTDLPGVDTIHQHEDIHIRQHHSMDVMFFELLNIIFWYNPVTWFYKRTIRNIHEYLADEAAARFQGDKESYAMLLLSKAFGVNQHVLTNNFFTGSLLKKRIYMLHKERSTKTAILKYGLFLPLFAIMLLFSSAKISSNEEIKAVAETIAIVNPAGAEPPLTDLIVQAQPVKTAIKKKSTLVKAEHVQLIQTDTIPPAFPGGMEKFYKFLGASLKYPEEAVKNNIQGKVYVSFNVEKDGSLSEIQVEKSLGGGIDEEAVRMLKSSPKWVPGTVKGQPVRVKYTLPIAFTLDKEKQDKKAQNNLPMTFTPDKADQDAKALVRINTNGKPQPLYVINGIKQRKDVSMENLGLNPNDIQSISVYKDTKALEMFGEEGKNGVIDIVTKNAAKKN